METTTLNPKYIYVQATEPSDKTEGKLWYKTTDNTLYTSDGSTYKAMETDTTEIQTLIQENAINILINSAGATTTLNDWDTMEADIFTDITGYLNTVDVGNTTATFSSDKYTNFIQEPTNLTSNNTPTPYVASASTEQHPAWNGFDGLVNTEWMATTTSGWLKIDLGSNKIINSITMEQSASNINNNWNPKNYTIQGSTNDSDWTTLDTITNQPNTASNTQNFVNTTGYRYYKVDITLTWGGSSRTTISNLKLDLTTPDYEDKIIQTNVETITANPTAHQVYCKNTTAGTGTATYNISFDNGSTWITEQEFNTKNTSVHNGTQLIIKLNLNGVGAGNTAEAENYAVMLFY